MVRETAGGWPPPLGIPVPVCLQALAQAEVELVCRCIDATPNFITVTTKTIITTGPPVTITGPPTTVQTTTTVSTCNPGPTCVPDGGPCDIFHPEACCNFACQTVFGAGTSTYTCINFGV
ncbi:hypothetical protein B0T17DRAFT_87078 [Bombardia bombarda]|uniref:Uncharacterized protein n=1 Tax=Bombardia bombarda TaxID=252184 RepID=A0AA39XMB7_9PEZI|nr:hypothetical protein B0T17DRAFT_87078 [Bombardia bombarda]